MDKLVPSEEHLRLEKQLCFPLYLASRLISKSYQPLLTELDLTYPQYLILLVLWEEDELPIKSISHQLDLNTNTLTPLLKRMEKKGFVQRVRSKKDERSVVISLTDKAKELKSKAIQIPIDIFNVSGLEYNQLLELKSSLNQLIGNLNKELKLNRNE